MVTLHTSITYSSAHMTSSDMSLHTEKHFIMCKVISTTILPLVINIKITDKIKVTKNSGLD